MHGDRTSAVQRLSRAFVRREDRIRGSGWLDCPNCHEHACQDVIDEMTFAVLLWLYRLTPVRRRRVLVCRRCGFRRPATEGELGALQTAGQPIRPAWLVPVGVTPILALVLVITLFVNHTGSASEGISYVGNDCARIVPCHYEVPSTFEVDAVFSDTPQRLVATDRTRPFQITLRRYDDGSSPAALIRDHFSDDTGINSVCVPGTAPSTRPATVAGQKGLLAVVYWSDNGDPVQEILYAFDHGKVDYLLTFHTTGREVIAAEKDVREHFLDTVKFTSEETSSASPSPTASPSPSPSPSPSASETTSSSSESTSTSSGAGSPCDFLKQVAADNPVGGAA